MNFKDNVTDIDTTVLVADTSDDLANPFTVISATPAPKRLEIKDLEKPLCVIDELYF